MHKVRGPSQGSAQGLVEEGSYFLADTRGAHDDIALGSAAHTIADSS